MSNIKLEALRARYQAKKLEALATLDVYMNAAVGVGEHPQIVDEMDELIKTIADVDGCLEALDKTFVPTNVDDTNIAGQTGPLNG